MPRPQRIEYPDAYWHVWKKRAFTPQSEVEDPAIHQGGWHCF